MSKPTPFYIIAPGHPLIEEWRPWFESFEKSDSDMVFLAEPSDIKNGNIGKVQQMAAALQHYPHLIEKMIFSVRLDFNLVEGIDMAQSEDWKRDPNIRHWLFKMAEMPMLMFLIKDSTSRFFMIADDIMSNIKPGSSGFDQNQTSTIAGRVFTSCYSFFMYCHNTGFEPDHYIDALLAEHDMPFTLENVKKKYLEDVG
jgi:hypothetical protein